MSDLNQFVSEELADIFDSEDLFSQVDQLNGESFREVANRRTIKTMIQTPAGEKPYFAKIHFGVGWSEIIKNLVQGRLPVLGARNEWLALLKLAEVGVPSMTPVLFCESGFNPAQRRSAILTKSLENTISLEFYEPDCVQTKWKLTNRVALMGRAMHGAGINHRDFYLCHFLMVQDQVEMPVLHLIDLHRAQIRQRVPRRWMVKDLGALLFSAFDKKLTKRDLFRFIRAYRGDLRASLESEGDLWREVVDRAKKLYLQDAEALPEDVVRLLEL
jgi:heptose I phosphotransferase